MCPETKEAFSYSVASKEAWNWEQRNYFNFISSLFRRDFVETLSQERGRSFSSCQRELPTGPRHWLPAGVPGSTRIKELKKTPNLPSSAIQSNTLCSQSRNKGIDWKLWVLLLEVLVWIPWDAEKAPFSHCPGVNHQRIPSSSIAPRRPRSRRGSRADQQN